MLKAQQLGITPEHDWRRARKYQTDLQVSHQLRQLSLTHSEENRCRNPFTRSKENGFIKTAPSLSRNDPKGMFLLTVL